MKYAGHEQVLVQRLYDAQVKSGIAACGSAHLSLLCRVLTQRISFAPLALQAVKESSQLQFGMIIGAADLVAFYRTHDPSKIASVDRIIEHYSVAELVKLLVAKYGEAPPVTRDYGLLLRAFFGRHNPSMVPKVPELLLKYAGQEKALLQRLYGAQVYD